MSRRDRPPLRAVELLAALADAPSTRRLWPPLLALAVATLLLLLLMAEAKLAGV